MAKWWSKLRISLALAWIDALCFVTWKVQSGLSRGEVSKLHHVTF